MKEKSAKLAASPKPRKTRHVSVAVKTMPAISGFVAGLVVATVFVSQAVSAASYQGPTQAAPGGNIPFTIWNRTASNDVQTNAAIAIDGGGPAATSSTGIAVGLIGSGPYSSALDLNESDAGQNVYYGAASFDDMNAGDNLIKLETYKSGDPNDGFTSRFSVSRDGDVKAAGCFGATFVGPTNNPFHGSLGSVGNYKAANEKCAVDYPADGSSPAAHVCRVEELLESIRCTRSATDPIRIHGGLVAWVNGGPPGYIAQSNDCKGWTDNTSSSYGRVWEFTAGDTGGKGNMTVCNSSGGLKFACCR
jgi:hypothetical protein